MFKKFLIGLLSVVIACAIARSGYEFGQYLAKKGGSASSAPQTAQG